MVFDQMWHKRWCRGQLFILSHASARHGILPAWGALLTSLIWPPWPWVMRQDRLCTSGSQRRNSPSNSRPNVHVPTCFFCLTACVMVCEYISNFWRTLVEIRTKCLHLKRFQRCDFWTPDWDLSFSLFVFVVIFWLETSTAFLEPKCTFSSSS